MHFPKFWAKGSAGQYSCWQWSDVSYDDARAKAQDGARKLSVRFANGVPEHKNSYWYGDRPLREPVLQEVKNSRGELVGLLTRNHLGVTVLNSEKALVVDIDVEEPEKKPVGFWQSLFGKKAAPQDSSSEEKILNQAREWCRSVVSWGWRVYKTKAGYRLIATHAPYSPESAETKRAFETLNADPLYQKLCASQKSFRARLSPKPWRCDHYNPPCNWPFSSNEQEAEFKQWLSEYEEACEEYATCKFIQAVGNQTIHEDLRNLISLHDSLSKANEPLPLA